MKHNKVKAYFTVHQFGFDFLPIYLYILPLNLKTNFCEIFNYNPIYLFFSP